MLLPYTAALYASPVKTGIPEIKLNIFYFEENGYFGVSQQQLPITGLITDGKNNPLPGVNVQLKGSRIGVQTDGNGRFTLNETPGKGILVVSYTGFATQEIPLNGKGATIDVSLSEQISNLNEVVVVGYGTQTKKDLTGAVSQVKVAQLENENPQSVQDALRGNVPGLSISQVNAASAKGGGDLQVRGRSSINAGTTPLIVLDGVIYQGQLSDINPNDIATIDVLKDASSTAVFGAKAAIKYNPRPMEGL